MLDSSPLVDFAVLAAEQEVCPDIVSLQREKATSGLDLRLVPHEGHNILCDLSLARPRPVVPISLQSSVFSTIHGLAHQGPIPTIKAISQRFVWKGMKRIIRDWCRTCHDCQASKVARHITVPLSPPPVPLRRFETVHVDIVGPLPEANGHKYVFTMIDRFSRWVEVYPLVTITAEACCTALLRAWISRFGVPSKLISDRGAQFTSAVWRDLNRLLGIDSMTTTAYHPQANGMI